jgi:hypothetical protein
MIVKASNRANLKLEAVVTSLLANFRTARYDSIRSSCFNSLVNCDDESVTTFDIANLGPFAFGLAAADALDIKDAPTGYLLLYSQVMGAPKQTRHSECIWLNIFFFSGRFVTLRDRPPRIAFVDEQ